VTKSGPEDARRQAFAWAVYDLANTLYFFLFVTYSFPLIVKLHLGGTEFHVGVALSTATVLSGLAVPFVGALSDKVGRRMPFIIVFTLLTCGAAAFVVFSGLYTAIALAVIAMFCYATGLAVYDALLPRVAPPERHGTISGQGVALGYFGTPIACGAAAALAFGLADDEAALRGNFFIASGGFLLVALYPFAMIREPKLPSGRTFAPSQHARPACLSGRCFSHHERLHDDHHLL